MRFVPTAVEGASIVELEPHCDARGSFSRTFCMQAFTQAGLAMQIVQTNLSRNPLKGTLRGMHYQRHPHGEPKIVQCVRGRIFDVAVDLRPESPTFRRWAAVTLSPDENRVFYIPAGCAHGFLTLEEDSDIVYLMGAPYVAGAGSGVRWDDPAFGIAWPSAPAEISERDSGYADWRK
jgi:dTDP-4-dehydrorhamnose 3,5-epimerase